MTTLTQCRDANADGETSKDKAERKAKRAAEREANRQRLEVYTEGVAMSCTAVLSRYY